MFHLFSAGEIHEQDDCECNDGHDSCPQACGFVIAVLDDHGDFLGYGCGFSWDVSGKHGGGSVFSQGSGECKDGSGGYAGACCGKDDFPEYFCLGHAQGAACVYEVDVYLLEGGPGVAVHEGEGYDGCRDDTA